MSARHHPRHPRLPYALHLAAGTAGGIIVVSLLSTHVASSALMAAVMLAVAVLGSWACLSLALRTRWRVPLWFAVGFSLGFVSASAKLPTFVDDDHVSLHLADWPQRLPIRVRVCLDAGPRRTRAGWQAVADVHALKARGESFVKVTGSLRIIWREDRFRPVTGECFEVDGRVVATDPDLQPFGWSSQSADERAGVAGRMFLESRGAANLLARLEPSPSAPTFLQWVEASVDRRRLEMEDAVLERSSARAASWVLAVGAGSRSGLESDDRDMMTRAGIAHLLAVSGLHLALFALSLRRVLEWLFSRSRILLSVVERRAFGAAATIPLAWLYVVFTGFGTAAIRAAIFVTCLSVAELSGRRSSLAGAIGLAATLILVANPAELSGPSFQLSLAAVGGISIATRRFGAITKRRVGTHDTRHSRLLRKAKRWMGNISTLARASLGASLATLPVLAYHFGAVSVSGLIANVAVAPVLAVTLIPLAGAALVIAPADPVLAAQLCALAERTVDLSFALLDPMTEVLADPWVVGRPTTLETLFYISALVCLAAAQRPGPLRRRALSRSLQWITLGLILSVGRLWPPTMLEVWFIPVGQGDSTLIRSPTGHTIIIDTGGGFGGIDPGRNVITPLLRGLGIGEVDLVVITHGDIDHAGGLVSLLEATAVRELWWGGSLEALSPSGTLGHALEQSRTAVRLVAESPIRQFELGPVDIEILHPRPDSMLAHRGGNNDSICLMVSYDGRRVLLPGDVERTSELELVSQFGRRLRADIVKAPHHGSRTSSSMELLSRVLPTHTVFSVGPANWFGFPHADVVARYRGFNSRTYRTDRDGLIQFRLSRAVIQVRTWGAAW